MDYLIKASAILAIFYMFYKLILERETFFQSNRIFLIIGIISALLLPLIVIPIYTEQVLNSISTVTYSGNIEGINEVKETFNWMLLIEYIYLSGILFFGIRLLISISTLVKFTVFGNFEQKGSFRFIKTTKDVTPFSFFNYIIYNPVSFKQEELEQILTHEKVHAYQWHSFDVLLSQIMTTFFWFNPFSWLYKKDLQQNLEFIADAVSQEEVVCEKTYQKLLLKTSVSKNQLALTNNFYNSLIKKRIIMLHKNRSKNTNQWKFALILPLIAAFIFTFNTKIVAQKPVKETQEVKVLKEVKEAKEVEAEVEVEVERIKVVELKKNHEVHDNIEAFIISKDAKNLDKIQKELSEKGVTAKFKNIKRNDKGEITSIKIDLKSKTSSANFAIDSDTPIKPIKITLEDDGSTLSIGSISNGHDIFFNKKGENVYIIEKKHGNHELHEIIVEGDKHEVIEITDKKVWVTKDGNKTIEIKHSADKHEVIDIIHKDGEVKNEIIDIKTDGGKMKFELSDSENKPMILLDGKEISSEKMDKLDSDKFESIHVLKGDKAIQKYGDKAKNGVVEIITKKK